MCVCVCMYVCMYVCVCTLLVNKYHLNYRLCSLYITMADFQCQLPHQLDGLNTAIGSQGKLRVNC